LDQDGNTPTNKEKCIVPGEESPATKKIGGEPEKLWTGPSQYTIGTQNTEGHQNYSFKGEQKSAITCRGVPAKQNFGEKNSPNKIKAKKSGGTRTKKTVWDIIAYQLFQIKRGGGE